MLVEKQCFRMPSYRTLGGELIENVELGYEYYGQLNEAGDNVILVPHYFSGTSHAAGKYTESDPEPGYWDALIGPGKAIDTDRYFVIGVDSLTNLNAKDPQVISTGPASINPATGKPYGMRFPIVTIRDFVEVQHALLESLGIRRLHAVVGVSMGSMQAMEWAVAYPDMVERVVAVTPHGPATSDYMIAKIDTWMSPIRLDPNWNGGDYYGGTEPQAGLAAAVKMVLLIARHHHWASVAFGRRWSDEARDPLQAMDNRYQIEDVFDQVAQSRAQDMDANSFLYLCKANQLFNLGHRNAPLEAIRDLRARVLVMPEASDLMLVPDYGRALTEALREAGKSVEYAEMSGGDGHLDGVLAIHTMGERIGKFIAED